jgi:hypothetical protein
MNKTGKHVPPPDPANFTWLEMHDTKDIVLSRNGQPLISVTLRAIHGDRVGLQITAIDATRRQVPDPRQPTVEKSQPDGAQNPGEAKK